MANDRVVSKKTFGNHGLVIPGREPSLKTNGGLMYYSYDGMRNVTELTDRHGDSIEQYRYDAKANLIDMNARWYRAQNGRFTTADPYTGDILTPYTQNRYAYVGNNPINRWDPLGYWEDGDSGLSSAAQADIRYLTKLYNSTDDKDERASIHEAANEIRKLDRDRWTTEDERKIGSWSGTPDIDYDTSIKLSDGWRTDWTRTDRYYEKYEVTRQRHTAYAGVISTTVSVRTDMTTTVKHGFDFRAFTPSEWYQENKAVLKQYHIPISQVNSYYEPKDAYSKTTSSSRSISSTEKIVSRNDNNDFKNGIISQGLAVAGVSNKIVGIDKDKWTGNTNINNIKETPAPMIVATTALPLVVPTFKVHKDNLILTLAISFTIVVAVSDKAGKAVVDYFTPDVIGYGDLTEAEVAANKAKNEKDQRFYGNPGDINTQGNTDTLIGPDGSAQTERHNTTHGNPKIHSNPHDHDITWDENGKPNFSKPKSYWDNPAPPLK